MVVGVTGVMGWGKSTVGRALARVLQGEFVEGDDHHSEASRARLRAGEPLSDADRAPWLATLERIIRASLERGETTVVACSALRARYRERLAVDPRVRFVLLEGPREVLEERLARRRGHFASAALLESQLRTLEPPAGGAVLRLDIRQPPGAIVAAILQHLGR